MAFLNQIRLPRDRQLSIQHRQEIPQSSHSSETFHVTMAENQLSFGSL